MSLMTPHLLGEEFQRVWMMFATTVLLCPTTYEWIIPDDFVALDGPVEEISSYDWSGATLDKLVTLIETYKSNGCSGALCGCLLVPVVSIDFHSRNRIIVVFSIL